MFDLILSGTINDLKRYTCYGAAMVNELNCID